MERQLDLDKLQDLEAVEYQQQLLHGPLNRSERQFCGRHRAAQELRPTQKRLITRKAIVEVVRQATVHCSFEHKSHHGYDAHGCDYHDYCDDYDGALTSGDPQEVMHHTEEEDIVKAWDKQVTVVTAEASVKQVMVTTEALVEQVMAKAMVKDNTEGQMGLDTQGSSLLHLQIGQVRHL